MSAHAHRKTETVFILELIKRYRSLPALWDTTNKDYNDRDKKEHQYNCLLEKYKERYPDAGKKELCKKVNSLRSNYKRERNRINSLEKNGGQAGEGRETKLWYYDALSFIQDIEKPSTSGNSINIEEPVKKQAKKEFSATDEMVRLVCQRLKEPQNTFQKAGELWGLKLQEMDRNQALIAERLINGVLFKGQIGQLSMEPSLITESRTSTPASPMEQNYMKFEIATDDDENN